MICRVIRYRYIYIHLEKVNEARSKTFRKMAQSKVIVKNLITYISYFVWSVKQRLRKYEIIIVLTDFGFVVFLNR